MVRLIFDMAVALSLLAVPPHHKGDVVFVQMSDPQVGFNDHSVNYAVSDSLLSEAVSKINDIRPLCVVVTGDLLNKWNDRDQLSVFERRIGKIDADIPVFYTPGNHDLPDSIAESIAEYKDRIGYFRFSYRKKHIAFIGFDSCCIKYGNAEEENEQFEWLSSELEKNRKCRHIFLFCHCPFVMESLDEPDGHNNFPKNLREKYLDLFKKYDVDAMFSGHSHIRGEVDIDGMLNIVSGSVARSFDDNHSGFTVVRASRKDFDYEYMRLKTYSDPDELTFVHMSDPQIGFMDESGHFAVSDSLLGDAVAAINRIKPSCVVVTGDMVNNIGNTEQHAILERRMGEIDPSVPVYYTPGNHDIPEFTPERLQFYLDFIGYDRFSFVQKDCAFIGFDSNRIRSGNAEAEEEQYEWIISRLEEYKDMRHIFVFCHCPIVRHSLDEADGYESFPMPLRSKYVETFKKYGVEAMFTGHTHVGETLDLDGLKSVNAGPVAKAFSGSFPGINVVTVYRDGLKCIYRPAVDVR